MKKGKSKYWNNQFYQRAAKNPEFVTAVIDFYEKHYGNKILSEGDYK